MRTAIMSALIVVALSAGCAVEGPEPASAPATTRSTTATPAESETGIPENVAWTKTLTRADIKAFGVTESEEHMEWAPDHTLTVIFKFGGGAWTQFANYGGGTPTVGDAGTYTLEPNGELQLYGNSGPTYRYSWSVDGRTLTLTMLDLPENSGANPTERMMTEGAYTRATR